MTTRKFFFLHNPKAGGTSLRSLVTELCPNGSIAPQALNAPGDDRINRARIGGMGGHDLYFGHYGYDVYQAVNAGHILLTNFRDPISRIHSIYRFWRHNVAENDLSSLVDSDAALVRLAKVLSFSDFIRARSTDLLLYISNFHFRQILSSGWAAATYSPDTMSIVRQRIEDMAWFYIAETPHASMTLFRATFPECGNIALPFHNASGGDASPITPSDAAYLISLNVMDYAIHAHAMAVQAARLSALPVALPGAQAAARA